MMNNKHPRSHLPVWTFRFSDSLGASRLSGRSVSSLCYLGVITPATSHILRVICCAQRIPSQNPLIPECFACLLLTFARCPPAMPRLSY